MTLGWRAGGHSEGRHEQAESSFATSRTQMHGYRVTCSDVIVSDRFAQSS